MGGDKTFHKEPPELRLWHVAVTVFVAVALVISLDELFVRSNFSVVGMTIGLIAFHYMIRAIKGDPAVNFGFAVLLGVSAHAGTVLGRIIGQTVAGVSQTGNFEGALFQAIVFHPIGLMYIVIGAIYVQRKFISALHEGWDTPVRRFL